MVDADGPTGYLPVTTDSDDAMRHFLAGRMMAFHYQSSRATRHLDAAIAADPGFVLAYLHRGGMSPNGERGTYFEQARAHRNRVTPDEGLMIDAFHAFLWDRRIEDAVTIFTDLAGRYEKDPYLPGYLGLRYLHNLGRPDLAKEQFERALQRDPGWSPAHLWLGHVALRSGDLDQAEEHLGRYLDLAPDEPRAHDSMGMLRLRQGREEDAEHSLERALALDPEFPDSREHLVGLEIRGRLRGLEQAVAQGNETAIRDIYHTMAGLSLPDRGNLEGSDAIAEFWTAEPRTLTLEPEELHLGLDPDLVTEVGRYRLGDATGSTGEHITLWLRTVTGWRVYRSVWTAG
jgi:tetratricopeptide (TPR) repeat protein